MSDTIPSDMVSVYDQSQSQWWLYYIAGGQVKFFRGPSNDEVEDSVNNTEYQKDTVASMPAKTPPPAMGNTQLGVCEYLDTAQQPQTRIYYLDKGNRIVELGWNREKGGWFRGALTSQEYEAAAASVITTAVTKNQLKVYYRGRDDDDGKPRLWVAWVTKGEETWSRRPIVTF